MAVTPVTGFKIGTKIKWTKRNGDKASGTVKKKHTLANGVWLETKVEGQTKPSMVRAQQATVVG